MTDSQDKNILVATNLHKSYGRGSAYVHVLRGLDLTVRSGEFLAVMGPSGCGKTTMLHVLGFMTPPDAPPPSFTGPAGPGQIVLNGMSVDNTPTVRNELRRKMIGFVFQRFNLISVLSAEDNVAVSLRIRGMKMDSWVDELFASLGVAHLRKRKPGEMSIGEQQRIAVVRALAHRPALLLADEPTGNLDSDNSNALLDIFRQMNKRLAQTIIMITHSSEAAAHADRIVKMRDGKIVDS